jgi:hypothetical protein
MKQRFDSDLGAAIKNSCRRTVVDTCSFNNQPVRIGGDADVVDLGVLHICPAILAQRIIACVKWNGFDNFTGNSLRHCLTPTMTILADSRS